MVSLCTVPGRGGRSCERFGGYKTINRIPLPFTFMSISGNPDFTHMCAEPDFMHICAEPDFMHMCAEPDFMHICAEPDFTHMFAEPQVSLLLLVSRRCKRLSGQAIDV